MTDNLEFLLYFIRVDFFIGFALYSVLYVVVSLLGRHPKIHLIDIASCRLVRWFGILYVLVWMALTVLSFTLNTEAERETFVRRATGPYAFAYWIMPLPWLVITQLPRFEKVRKSKVLRLFFSVCLMVSFEQFVIIMTSFHRDYLPSGWSMHYSAFDLIGGIFIKITIWLALTLVFLWIYSKVAAYRNRN